MLGQTERERSVRNEAAFDDDDEDAAPVCRFSKPFFRWTAPPQAAHPHTPPAKFGCDTLILALGPSSRLASRAFFHGKLVRRGTLMFADCPPLGGRFSEGSFGSTNSVDFFQPQNVKSMLLAMVNFDVLHLSQNRYENNVFANVLLAGICHKRAVLLTDTAAEALHSRDMSHPNSDHNLSSSLVMIETVPTPDLPRTSFLDSSAFIDGVCASALTRCRAHSIPATAYITRLPIGAPHGYLEGSETEFYFSLFLSLMTKEEDGVPSKELFVSRCIDLSSALGGMERDALLGSGLFT